MLVWNAAGFSQSAETQLQLRHVTLYKHGVGYFERRGQVNGDQQVTFSFDAAQMNDVLKSLVVLDLSKGKIGAVTFDSAKPLEKQLANFAVTLDRSNVAGMTALLSQLKGARVEVRTGVGLVTGAIVGLEKRVKAQNNERIENNELVLMSEGGELRMVDLDQIRGIRLLDAKLREDLERHLSILQSGTHVNARKLAITANGSGTRDLFVSYVMEAPVWKTTYRVVMDGKGRPFLQGWAVVDNTQDEDWNNVTLSLVAGMPVSFIQDLQQPRYRRRPVVAPPDELTVNPQLAEAALVPLNGRTADKLAAMTPGVVSGYGGRIEGKATDSSGAAVGGATIRVRNASSGQEFNAVTDSNGHYAINNLPQGMYEIKAESSGFKSMSFSNVALRFGAAIRRNIEFELGGLSETVTITAESKEVELSSELQASSELFPTTSTQDIGELFEYRIDQPVTIKRNSSALIPIVQTNIEGESVSLYNAASLKQHPMSALYLTNTTGLTLEAGPMTLIENNTYAGEALAGRVKPGEKRFITYAVDLGCRVSIEADARDKNAYLVEILNGDFRVHYKQSRATTYNLVNVTPQSKNVYVEHPRRKAEDEKWKLVDTIEPVETTENYYRFKLTVAPNSTLPFKVTEELPDVNAYQLSNITPDNIQLFIKNNYLNAEMKQSLESILELKAQLNSLSRQLEEKQQAIAALTKDQERMRENLRALGKTEEEKKLVIRYVSRLSEDEDEIEKLRKVVDQFREQRTSKQEQLNERLRKLAMQNRVSS